MADPAARPEPERPPHERRSWGRRPCNLPVSCHPYITGKQTLWTGRAVEISRGGVRVEMGQTLELWSSMILRVQNPATGVSMTSLGRVLHLREFGAGKWHVGFCFARVLSDEDFEALLRNEPPTSQIE